MNRKMFTYSIVILLLANAASVLADVAWPLRVSGNHRYFEDQNGMPFFYNGDTAWQLFVWINEDEATDYLDNRKAKNFTAVMACPNAWAPGITNTYGELPFHNNLLGNFNENHWARVDRTIAKARARDMFVVLVPAMLGCCGGGWDDAKLAEIGLAGCRNYGRALGSRFRDDGNVGFCLGGDRDPNGARDYIIQIGEGIQETMPGAFIAYHAGTTKSSTDHFADQDWLTWSYTYTYYKGRIGAGLDPDFFEEVYWENHVEYTRNPTRPFVLGEAQYEGYYHEDGTDERARKQAYWSCLSGGFGHMYGGRDVHNFQPE